LTQGLKKFSEELTEAIKSMTGGVKLRKPSKEFEFENVKEAAENDRAVAHYEKLM
jgi:hypothetical protein